MQLRKYRWSRVYESAEEELLAILRTNDITYNRWEGEPGEIYPAHAHDYDKTLWCSEGSIIFDVNGKRISMQPGDTLDLPANTIHSAVAGHSGCVCYESHVS